MEACLGTTAQRTGGLGSEHNDRVQNKSGDLQAAKVVTSVFPAGEGCQGEMDKESGGYNERTVWSQQKEERKWEEQSS